MGGRYKTTAQEHLTTGLRMNSTKNTIDTQQENEQHTQYNGFKKSYQDLENECVSHMYNNGFRNVPTPLDKTGKLIKFGARDKKNEKTEWYKAGIIENGDLIVTYNSHHDSLHHDENYVFTSKANHKIDESELEAQRQKVREIQLKRESEESEKEEKRKRKAISDRDRFNKASIIGESPYLQRKQVGVHEIRFEIIENETILLIPMRDELGEIQALQEIYPTKRLFQGHEKPRDKNFTNATKGLFHVIGNIVNGQEIRVSEGYATAGSCYESIGCGIPHVVAFSAGAYKEIIPTLRKLYPNSHILICADNNDVGITAAKNSVESVKNCSFVYPIFQKNKEIDENGKYYADFNDLMLVEGKEKVRTQLEFQSISRKDNNQEKVMQTECEIDFDDNGIETEDVTNDDKIATTAMVHARRLAIKQATKDELVKIIRRQYPSILDKADDIASKALLWASKQQPRCEVIVNGIPKTITDMISLDLRFAQLEAPGKPCVTINRIDAQPISSKDFNQRLSGEVVLTGVDNKGQPKYVAASTYWTGNTHKRVYKNIVFTNKTVGDDTYNLFTGFGVIPKKGKCDLILSHIKDVICAGNDLNNTALLNLLAWQIQNIGKPSRIITALKSKAQQIGKGFLLQDIILKIYGPSGFMTGDVGQIITRFNDTLRGKAYVFLDEALLSGDRKSADALKYLSTTTEIPIETKGVPTVTFPVALNFFLSSNNEDATYVEEADARHWILEVSPHKFGNTEYFDALDKEINGGGLETFMYYLINLDVSNFVPSRDVPKDNEFKDAMIRASISPLDARKWLEDCCYSEMIIGLKPTANNSEHKLQWQAWETGDEYTNGQLFGAYTEWQKGVKSQQGSKSTASNNFGKLLTAVGFSCRTDREKRRNLPNVEICLDLIKNLGKR